MEENREELRAGVIGLGMIGGGVAVSLRNSGHKATRVWNRSPEKYKRYKGCKNNQAENPKEVAENCDVIMMALFDAEQTKSILTREDGVLAGAHEGLVVVCLSTIKVDEAKELAEICAQKGVGFIDCGVTPGMLADENGLVGLCGGDQDVYDYAKPVLDWWSAGTVLLGPVGSGMAGKIARNMITYGAWSVISEATKLAAAFGIHPNKFEEVLTLCDKQDTTFYKIIGMLAPTGGARLGDGYGDFLLNYFKKDLGASAELSEQLGIELPVRDFIYEHKEKILDLE